MTEPPRKLCVLAEPYLSETEARSLQYAVDNAAIEIPLVVVHEPADPDYDPELKAEALNDGIGVNTVRLFFEVLARERAWAFVIAEKKIAELLGSDSASSRSIYVEDVPCLSDSEFLRVTPTTDGNWAELPPDAVDRIRESCDVVVRYGFGLLRGEVLDATEFGVLSFHPADIRKYRGLGPPQAFLDDRDVMGVTLQRLNEEVDGGEIVAYRETDVSECFTLWEVYDALDEIQVELLAEGIATLRDPDSDTVRPESLGPYYSTESRRTLSFAGRILYKNVRGRIRKRA